MLRCRLKRGIIVPYSVLQFVPLRPEVIARRRFFAITTSESSTMSVSMVWFRNDLRIHDNAALTRACHQAAERNEKVVCVYVIDPFWFGKTSFGFDRIGPFRKRFLHQSLQDLSERLAEIGGRLDVIRGATAQILQEVAVQQGVRTVYCNREVACEEVTVQQAVRDALTKHQIALDVSHENTLLDRDDLPFDIEQLPDVFSRFRRKVEKQWCVRPPLPAVQCVPASEQTLPQAIDCDSAAELAGGVEADPRRMIAFHGGESAGLERVNEYFFQRDRLRRYKETRNGMLAADDSSKLSPWLAHGCLSSRMIYHEIQRYEEERIKNESTYWLVFELLWRDYFAWTAERHGNDLFGPGGLQRTPYPWRVDWPAFDRWRNGQTGFPLIDANMRELKSTGFMSNRGRQNVASFLTKNLGLDWRLGAEWFESLLIDYDPASNYGNWNYVAGVGNDVREFRWFNTLKQSRVYDSDGSYVRHWLNELSGVATANVHAPWEMSLDQQNASGCRLGEDYPLPIVDLFESADRQRELFQSTSDAHSNP